MEAEVKIVLRLDDEKLIELTEEEAEKLYAHLKKVFEKDTAHVPIMVPCYPYPEYKKYPEITWEPHTVAYKNETIIRGECNGSC